VLPADETLRDSLRGASLLVETITGAEDQTDRRDIVAAAQADYSRLLAVLFEAGHFGPVISISIDGREAADLPAVNGTAPVETVEIAVRPGPRYLFRQAEIAPAPRRADLPEGFAPGSPAGTDILRETARAGVEAWRARGHAKAALAEQRIVADHADDRIDAILTLAPGPRLSYGTISVEGTEDVRPGQVSRIADLRTGRVYDPEQIRDAAQRLQRTGAFRSVTIDEADQIAPRDRLPMTIRVVERLPRRIGFGAELETSEGLGLTAFWLHRNLTGLADSLRVEGEVTGIGGETGGEDYALSFAYNRPATFNPETDLFVTGEIESLDQPSFTLDRIALEAGGRRIVNEEFAYSYALSLERSEARDAFGDRSFFVVGLPLEATYDRRDDPLNPADGYYVEAWLKPFYGVERAGPGLRFEADMRGYQGFGRDRRSVAALRLQLGSVVGPGLSDIPSDDLFFSGGGGTVRGQEFQSLGVDLASGRRVGGRSFAGLSAELRQAVTERIGIVGFYDVALVSEESYWTDGDTHSGAGLGLRYDTGIGPIRVDLGVPVDGPDDPSGYEIYIGIGQAF
jgi:translocation and assembly module TamA